MPCAAEGFQGFENSGHVCRLGAGELRGEIAQLQEKFLANGMFGGGCPLPLRNKCSHVPRWHGRETSNRGDGRQVRSEAGRSFRRGFRSWTGYQSKAEVGVQNAEASAQKAESGNGHDGRTWTKHGLRGKGGKRRKVSVFNVKNTDIKLCLLVNIVRV